MHLNLYIKLDLKHFILIYIHVYIYIFFLQKTRTVSQIRSIKRKSTEKKYTVTEKIEVTRVSLIQILYTNFYLRRHYFAIYRR